MSKGKNIKSRTSSVNTKNIKNKKSEKNLKKNIDNNNINNKVNNKNSSNIVKGKTEPRAKRKKKNTVKVLIVVLSIAIVVAILYLLLKHPTFNISSFELDGTNKYTAEEIAEKLNIKKGNNIFLETVKYKKENLIQFSYIENLNFEFKLPDTLKIKVIERTSSYLAYDKEKDKYFKLDNNGYILEEGIFLNKEESELLIYGITFDDEIIFGEKINEIDMSKIITFLDIKKEFEKSGINKNITKVNFENSLTTLTLNDKLNVIFPNKDELTYKMAFLKEILKSIGEDATGVVDLTKTNPTYSSV